MDLRAHPRWLEGEIEGSLLVDRENDILLLQSLKAGSFHFQTVGGGPKSAQNVVTIGPGFCSRREISAVLGDGHGRIAYNSASRVRNHSPNLRLVCSLAKSAASEKDQEHQACRGCEKENTCTHGASVKMPLQ